MQPTVDDKASEIVRGRTAAIQLLNEGVAQGQTRAAAAQRIFILSNGEANTLDQENWFDEGVRSQLADLGFKE